MKVLVACEFSGIVREAFKARGHDAWSLDILPTEIPGNHFQDFLYTDKIDYLQAGWDMVIAHPPCTRLASSGARWMTAETWKERWEAIKFFMHIVEAPVPKICIENPIGIMSTVYRKPDQIIQPWQFGHGETKATCLWLKGLPKLIPTNIVEGREARIHRMPPSENRGKDRSRTYKGIAEAMAAQWG